MLSTVLPEVRRVKLSSGLDVSFRFLGRGSRRAVVLVHGNLSSSLIWEDLMPRIPEDFDVVAPDLRGFGGSGRVPVKGSGDFSADLLKLLQSLRYDSYVLVDHSMGGGVVLQMLLEAPRGVRVEKVVLVDPVSPYGFGGTKDEFGTPCYSDHAGSGAGLVAKSTPTSLGCSRLGTQGSTTHRHRLT